MSREQEAKRRRLKTALLATFDTGNALQDAWDQLLLDEDSCEIELALIGEPEIVEVREADGLEILVLKDAEYYIDRLRDNWIEAAIDALDFEEAHHGNRRQ